MRPSGSSCSTYESRLPAIASSIRSWYRRVRALSEIGCRRTLRNLSMPNLTPQLMEHLTSIAEQLCKLLFIFYGLQFTGPVHELNYIGRMGYF